MASTTVRKPGRPRVYTPRQRYNILRCIRKHGLTRGRRVLADRGLHVSMTLLIAVAKEHGLTFKPGRPLAA